MVNSTSGATFSYGLYQDSSRLVNWGNDLASWMGSFTGNGADQTYTIYGQIPVQNWPAPAAYSDTVTITVTY